MAKRRLSMERAPVKGFPGEPERPGGYPMLRLEAEDIDNAELSHEVTLGHILDIRIFGRVTSAHLDPQTGKCACVELELYEIEIEDEDEEEGEHESVLDKMYE